MTKKRTFEEAHVQVHVFHQIRNRAGGVALDLGVPAQQHGNHRADGAVGNLFLVALHGGQAVEGGRHFPQHLHFFGPRHQHQRVQNALRARVGVHAVLRRGQKYE